MIYLSCTECGVEARLPDGNKILIESFNDFLDTLDEWNTTQFQVASSMDFPEEYTDNKHIISLVNQIVEEMS